MIETAMKPERLILVGISVGDGEEAIRVEKNLDELKELVDTAGGTTVGRLIQRRESIHPVTYLGKGKIEELREMLWQLSADGIVCDDELSPVQLKNLERELNTKIMDRTLVILDIFAARASSGEGKLQVELAQLKYRATRLVGMRDSLSRLGGGIGTRGPGEKKLEIDRRLIHERIGRLKAELGEVKEHREVNRAKRKKENKTVAAIVGYTNAGKSTLLNAMTGADALSEDKLFATLDPLTRSMAFEHGGEILLTDTVGFINKLPHNLIDAFRATLEETLYADLIIHVVDASDPEMDMHMHVVYETLQELGVRDKPIITVFNKMDRVSAAADAAGTAPILCRDLKAVHTVYASAATGYGLGELQQVLEQTVRDRALYVALLLSYEDAGKVQLLRRYGQLLKEEYTEEGVEVEGYIPPEYYHELRDHALRVGPSLKEENQDDTGE